MKRDKVIRIGVIVIVLTLLLSLLAGAFSFAPAQAAAPAANSATLASLVKSVQIWQVSSEVVDTAGDGIENNQDPDVDGDGVVNGEDNDIDGDGIENFDDADPIDTTDIDSKSPEKPDRPAGVGDIIAKPSTWLPLIGFLILATMFFAWLLIKRRKS